MRGCFVRQVVDHARRLRYDPRVFLALRVQDAQRIDLQRLTCLRGEVAAVLLQEAPERVEESGSRGRVAERGEQQAVVAQAERPEEAVEQRDDLDVQVGI